MELLEYHTHRMTLHTQFLFSKGSQFHAVQKDLTGSRTFQQVDAAHKRTFSCAAQPDDTKYFPLVNIQVDIMQHFNGIFLLRKAFADAPQLNHGFFFFHFSITFLFPGFSFGAA